MAFKAVDNTPWGRLRAFYEKWTASPSTPQPTDSISAPEAQDRVPDRIGRYKVERKIGEGGMGVVYAARDERLDRIVALKTMSSLRNDASARTRFWREARVAAGVNHPNVCQIFEIGDERGELFIAMEFLEGESLAERLRRGSMSTADAANVGLAVLAALSALHDKGIVHRDLKPSNVFLTVHGVKLLDFGLARPEARPSLDTATGLTRSGMIVGTPRYMAPEQVTGGAVDTRADLFSMGALLFEMLAGRPAFDGATDVDILHATVHKQPPALVGSPAVVGIDRIIRRALAKRPADRPESASAMAADLRAVHAVSRDDSAAVAHPLTRIVVLPFRPLRPDADSDFLAFSLPDAIAMSLSGIDSLVVRSSAVAARFAGDAPDLKAVAAEADVDRVVLGTLLRSGDQLRVAVQLVDAPSGTLVTSHTAQSSLDDLFRLQDEIARRVVQALSLPLKTGAPSPAPDAPRDPRAYELYLRANELARTYNGLSRARELYERCVELDPGFAPAWAHLGRCHRVIGKYIAEEPDSDVRAEECLQRALDINPRLSVAHKYYANLEADIGQAEAAVVRLLREASRHGNDPELFAGLVHACRYCGLYDESIAAHAEARRLDPNVPTSLEQTLLMTGDIDRLLAVDPPLVVAGADDGIRIIGLGLAGRREEAKRMLLNMRRASHIPAFQSWTWYLMAWLEGRSADMTIDRSLGRLKIQEDPEAIFQEGWLLCDAGAHERGLEHVRRAVAKGYFVAPTLAGRPHFDALRGDPVFQQVLADAEAGRRHALAAFGNAGGEGLLGTIDEGAGQTPPGSR